MAVVCAMVTVPAVHEKMQKRAQKQQSVWQEAEEVRGMLGDEEESGDGKESDQDPHRFGS